MFSSFHKSKGFSIVELLVTMSIMIVITMVVIYNQRDYITNQVLQNTASSIALDIRKAQVFGIAVREFPSGASNFNIGYGIFFEAAGLNDIGRSYEYFADFNPKNGTLDGLIATCSTPGPTVECLDRTPIDQRVDISQICIVPLSGADNCTPHQVAVTFNRPDPTAHFKFYDLSGALINPGVIKGARLHIITRTTATKDITIYTTGQIYVQ